MTPEMGSTDWSRSYSQYLARSAALSARTLNLYQLALERVSQGALPPTIFQDHYPAFILAHGAEFSNRLLEAGSRFLTDLVQLPVAVNPGDGPPPPPRFDLSDPSRWYAQIAEYAGQLNARALKAYTAQLQHVAAGEATPSEIHQHTSERMTRELPGYMQRLTQLYFDLLNSLNEVRSAYEETYFRGLLASTRPEDSDAPVALTFAGPSGAAAGASIGITNTTAQRARIGYQIFDARRVDGGGPNVVPALTFSPAALELGPAEEASLTVSLVLDPEHYDPDVLYIGKLHFTGAFDTPLEVDLRILATTSQPDGAGKGST